MQYFGGKQRIAKDLCNFLNEELKEGQPFVDLFCGACNIISGIDDNRVRIANDKHKYLIAMWKALQNGWIPPDTLSEEEYYYIKENKDKILYLSGFVGFGCSFAGKWFGGYARNSRDDNYCLNAKNSLLKQIKTLHNVKFCNIDYKNFVFKEKTLIYCDIPYRNTTTYCKKEVGIFNHNEFYQWVKNNSDKHDIYISEYEENVPNDFEIVWKKESNQEIRNKDNKRKKTTEVLIRYKN